MIRKRRGCRTADFGVAQREAIRTISGLRILLLFVLLLLKEHSGVQECDPGEGREGGARVWGKKRIELSHYHS